MSGDGFSNAFKELPVAGCSGCWQQLPLKSHLLTNDVSSSSPRMWPFPWARLGHNIIISCLAAHFPVVREGLIMSYLNCQPAPVHCCLRDSKVWFSLTLQESQNLPQCISKPCAGAVLFLYGALLTDRDCWQFPLSQCCYPSSAWSFALLWNSAEQMFVRAFHNEAKITIRLFKMSWCFPPWVAFEWSVAVIGT